MIQTHAIKTPILKLSPTRISRKNKSGVRLSLYEDQSLACDGSCTEGRLSILAQKTIAAQKTFFERMPFDFAIPPTYSTDGLTPAPKVWWCLRRWRCPTTLLL